VEGGYGAVIIQDGRQHRDINRLGDLSIGVEERGGAPGYVSAEI
jgi:hypothetical protein